MLNGVPRESKDPHAYREIYLDRQTLRVLYGFGYDNHGCPLPSRGEIRRLIGIGGFDRSRGR